MTEFIELTDDGKTVVNVSHITGVRRTSCKTFVVYIMLTRQTECLHCEGDYIEFLSKLKVTRA